MVEVDRLIYMDTAIFIKPKATPIRYFKKEKISTNKKSRNCNFFDFPPYIQPVFLHNLSDPFT